MEKFNSILSLLLALCMILSLAAYAGAAEAVPTPVPTQTAAPALTPAAEPAAVSYTPGAFTATAGGHNGPVTVETTVDEDSILSVAITEDFESAGVQAVINRVPEAIVAQQSLAVDTVTGATFCGRAVISAVTDCLTQAGADVSLLQTSAEKEPEQDAAYEADVIVIGAGGSGLAVAVSAHQSGANVLVVEKLGMTGGSTAFSGGAFNAADPERSKLTEMTDSNRAALLKLLDKEPQDDYEAGLQKTIRAQYGEHAAAGNPWLFDSAELHMLQTYNGGDYMDNPDLITTLCENALPTVEWMESLGVTFQENLGMATGAIWQRSHHLQGE